ncbi:MAG TPA: DUF998 domain-containing protein [Candidatus Saccharimonadales bacterium]
MKILKTLAERYPLIGPGFWILTIQYLIAQLVVAQAWTMPYSLSQNTISDLGVTKCGVYPGHFANGQFVCSPLHGWMNASFLVLGLSMIIGAVLIYQKFHKSLGATVGFSFMALGGFGTLLVGLFPENTASGLHIFGAVLPFFVGNIGMVVLGSTLAVPRGLRIYTILSGVISLVALMLLLTMHYLGIGIGGIERVTSYPQTIWFIVFGIYMVRNRARRML